MKNDDEGRRKIGLLPPGSEEQRIVPTVPVQMVRSHLRQAVNQALGVGIGIEVMLTLLPVVALVQVEEVSEPDS